MTISNYRIALCFVPFLIVVAIVSFNYFGLLSFWEDENSPKAALRRAKRMAASDNVFIKEVENLVERKRGLYARNSDENLFLRRMTKFLRDRVPGTRFEVWYHRKTQN